MNFVLYQLFVHICEYICSSVIVELVLKECFWFLTNHITTYISWKYSTYCTGHVRFTGILFVLVSTFCSSRVNYKRYTCLTLWSFQINICGCFHEEQLRDIDFVTLFQFHITPEAKPIFKEVCICVCSLELIIVNFSITFQNHIMFCRTII